MPHYSSQSTYFILGGLVSTPRSSEEDRPDRQIGTLRGGLGGEGDSLTFGSESLCRSRSGSPRSCEGRTGRRCARQTWRCCGHGSKVRESPESLICNRESESGLVTLNDNRNRDAFFPSKGNIVDPKTASFSDAGPARTPTPTHDLIRKKQSKIPHGQGFDSKNALNTATGPSAAARWYCCLHSCHCVLPPVCRLSGHRE